MGHHTADSRPSIRRREHFEAKIRPLKSLHSQKKVVSGVDQMPFFENTKILCRDPYVLVNYSTMKIEIAFMLNLERPITATQLLHGHAFFTVGIYRGASIYVTVICVST